MIYFGNIFVNIDDANNIGIDNNIDIDNNIEIDDNLDNYNDIHNDNNIEIDNNIDDRSFSVQPQISAEVQLVGAPRHTETTLTCTAEVTLTIRLWWTLQWTLWQIDPGVAETNQLLDFWHRRDDCGKWQVCRWRERA